MPLSNDIQWRRSRVKVIWPENSLTTLTFALVNFIQRWVDVTCSMWMWFDVVISNYCNFLSIEQFTFFDFVFPFDLILFCSIEHFFVLSYTRVFEVQNYQKFHWRHWKSLKFSRENFPAEICFYFRSDRFSLPVMKKKSEIWTIIN